MKNFLTEIESKKVLVSDGAWGTELFKIGLKPGECPELWNEIRKDDVLKVAKSYIDAGSDIISTNSFGGSSIKLSHYGLDKKSFELNKLAATISREVAADKFVMGSIGPSGKFLMTGEISTDELVDSFSIQAKALAEGGVDAILLETFYDIDEAECALKAVRSETSLPVICSFTFDRKSSGEYRTMMGSTVKDVLQALITLGVDVIGVNCGEGYGNMIDLVNELRNYSHNIPLLVQPNAGLPENIDGKIAYTETPEIIESSVKRYLESGVNIIGGCCGTTPDHIRIIRRLVDEHLKS